MSGGSGTMNPYDDLQRDVFTDMLYALASDESFYDVLNRVYQLGQEHEATRHEEQPTAPALEPWPRA